MCTGLRLTCKDGTRVHGRTIEFGLPLDLEMLFLPVGTALTSALASGPGASWTTTHAAVGGSAFGGMMIMDGINDAGLAAGSFHFTGCAQYTAQADADPSVSLNAADLPLWLLTTVGTIDEAKDALAGIRVVDTPIAHWGPTAPPFHYVVYDVDGGCIVVEPRGGELLIHDNPIGVMTNAPEFPFHLAHLSQFVNLSPAWVGSSDVFGMPVAATGMGSGALGMPGDFTPPSRFVRAAFFSANHPGPANATAGVQEVFHLLNLFDLPLGTNRLGDVIEWTEATVVRNPHERTLAWRTFTDQTIRTVHLDALVAAATGPRRMKAGALSGDASPVLDATGDLLAGPGA